jgi:hypothetical protein
MRQFLMFIVCGAVATASAGEVPIYPYPLERNFDAVYRPGELAVDAIAAAVQPDYYLARPWYLSPYRNYSYYRPWYTYGYYGPTWYRYHYAPSWGYRQPWYGPHYLNPGAIAPPPGDQLYHW